MRFVPLVTAAIWVDFFVVVLSKFVPLTKALPIWYEKFGVVAAFSDVTIIVLGILLAQLIYPGISGWSLVATAVMIQLVHDTLFYLLVILPLPSGQNAIIDLFKQYAAEGSWQILVADAAMVAASVVGAEWLQNSFSSDITTFSGLLGAYALSYIVYTK
jgi:hypothetical protein